MSRAHRGRAIGIGQGARESNDGIGFREREVPPSPACVTTARSPSAVKLSAAVSIPLLHTLHSHDCVRTSIGSIM